MEMWFAMFIMGVVFVVVLTVGVETCMNYRGRRRGIVSDRDQRRWRSVVTEPVWWVFGLAAVAMVAYLASGVATFWGGATAVSAVVGILAIAFDLTH